MVDDGSFAASINSISEYQTGTVKTVLYHFFTKGGSIMAKETEAGLRKIQFTKTLLGYACEEVDTYLAHVNDRYIAVVRECSELKKKMAVVAAGQNEFREDALREKAKIAAEADAMLAEKKAVADALIHEAEQKAAMILSKAEGAAAGILKQAEDEAESLRQKNATQLKICKDTERKLRSHNNTADRLVEEIDSFREKVFAMYANHIEALEQLSQLTDDFYKAKEELTTDVASDTEASPIETLAPAIDSAPEEIYSPLSVMAPPAPVEEVLNEEDEDLLRIDWQEHKQKQVTRETEEAEKMASKTLWEIAEDAHAASLDTRPVEEPTVAEDPQDAEPDMDGWEEPTLEPMEPEKNLPMEEPLEETPGTADTSDLSDETDPIDEGDLLEDLERDLFAAYAKGGVDGAEEAVDAFDLETLMAEEVPVADTEDEEDFLSDIASEYLSHPAIPQEPDANEAEPAIDITATAADNLDELLDDEQSHDVSLTGEFDKIFSSKKSAAYVNEVSRQPLVEAQKPEKPKKHK